MLSKLNLLIRPFWFSKRNTGRRTSDLQEISASWVCVQVQVDRSSFQYFLDNELVVKRFLLYKKTGDKCNGNSVLSKCVMKCGLESHKTDGKLFSSYQAQKLWICSFNSVPRNKTQQDKRVLRYWGHNNQVDAWNKTCFHHLLEKFLTCTEGCIEKLHTRGKEMLKTKN